MQKSVVVLFSAAVTCALAACGGLPAGPASGSSNDSGAGAPVPAKLFPNAAWLYNAPTGAGLNISSMTAGVSFQLNTHSGGFDYPVAYADGSLGCTNFTDTLVFNDSDRLCVPNPPGGFHSSYGGWGNDDGHLVVVDSGAGVYYDFWKLYSGPAGTPTSTNVGQIVRGNLGGNGTPGTTAAAITSLAGDILPGELDCATCLNHALSVVVPVTMNSTQIGQQAPAAKTDGTVPGAIFREGAKIRFDPSIDLTALNVSTATRAILRALQLYGGVISDQTGGTSVGFYSALAAPPDLTGLSVTGEHLWIYY